MARIVLLENQKDRKSVDIQKDEFLVGRDLSCDFVLDDLRSSRRHFLIERQSDRYFLKNLSKTNGTRVNGQKVDRVELADGDQVTLGESLFRFETCPPAPQTPFPFEPDLGDEAPLDMEKSVIFYSAGGESSPDEMINALRKSSGLDSADADDERDGPGKTVYFEKRFIILRDVVQSIVSELDLKRVFERILEHVFNFVKAERGCVMTFNTKTGALDPQVARERDSGKVIEGFPMSRTICDQVLNDKVAILSTNAMADERFSDGDSIMLQGIRSVMSAPVIFQNEAYGLISVDSRDTESAFSEEDLETLSIIANLAGLAIHNARMVQNHVRIEVARQNFERFLPPSLARRAIEEGKELALGGGNGASDHPVRRYPLLHPLVFDP